MTMRHPGPESVFNPTRHLVAISDRVLTAWDTPSEEWRDTLTESEDPLSPGLSRASESPGLLSLSSPESPNRCSPMSADHLKPAHLEILSSDGISTSTTVLDASLTLPGRLSKSCPVIMKVVHEHFNFHMVAREVKAYRQLQDLSVVVPHLFAVMREPADPSSAIMVLENAGERIGHGCWDDVVLDESDKKEIYFTLAQIHARGVLHGDVMPRNVVRRPHGGMCFVDFGLAEVGHRCDPQSCFELVKLRRKLGLPDNIVDDRAAGQEC
ncbi:hypothetical protein GGX14DRAFT_428204 [Mycena pura]|uniref:Protein kinase domain-containing protein n=1 Tax=Mycena pura TaxID=153505 RepID=A0AAD6VU40_9AGAR|nr:hypothetical protein GGX14DRAFT_428204 [Mycena pura]